MTEFNYSIDSDGVAIISWDVPNKNMNVMSLEGLTELDNLFDQALLDEQVKGIILTSGKSDFAGGMDLNVLADMKTSQGDNPAQGIFNGVMQIHKLLRKIELAGMDFKTKKGAKPVAAAITGTAAGIGLELPLACHRIFAVDNKNANFSRSWWSNSFSSKAWCYECSTIPIGGEITLTVKNENSRNY